MRCPSCRQDNADSAKFCEGCGIVLERTCAGCGKPVSPDARFCNSCGRNLTQAPALVESSGSALSSHDGWGERRNATVMFSDLSGYTSMNERLDPEVVEDIMSRIRTKSVEIVESNGGIVNQIVGDEVVALFGIPIANEDDPRRAVKAGMELHRFVRKLSLEVESRVGSTLRMHTGINTGLVVTHLRDDREGRYGITGDTVNTAARLMSHAQPDEILLGPDTHRLVDHYFKTEALESVALKGKAKPLVPFRVLGETAVKTRFEAAAVTGLTVYSGRQSELAILDSCLKKALAGQGQFVSVSGAAGLGKSRLLHEFRHRTDRSQFTVLQGRCQTYGEGTPYLPFLDALRRGLNLKEEDTQADLHNKIVANVRDISSALEKHIPLYLHLLSIPSTDHPVPEHLKGPELAYALREALTALIILNTQSTPMVVIFEDWHWADEASILALNHLVGALARYRLMVVVNYRPEHRPTWGQPSHYTSIILNPLEREHTEAVIHAMWGTQSIPAGLRELIHDRTGGNPYFIEEISSNLIEDGTVAIKNGSAELTRSFDSIALPDSVQTVIRTRLDRLDKHTREALRIASVIGREFGRRILESIHEAKDRLSESLEDLNELELIQQIRVVPEAEYMFKHVITQQVTYDTLLFQQRRKLHGLVANVIESLYADRREEHYESLAFHFSRSDDTDKALTYLKLAAEKAAGYFSLDQARNFYREAIEILDKDKRSPERMRQRIDLSLRWAAVSYYASTPDHLEFLAVSRTYALELEDKVRLANVMYCSGRMFYVWGRFREALAQFEECLHLAKEVDDSELIARSTAFISRTLFYTTEFERSVEYAKNGMAMLERFDQEDELLITMLLYGTTLGFMGDFKQSLSELEETLQRAKEINNPVVEATALFFLGMTNSVKGDWACARSASAASVAIHRRIGNHLMTSYGEMTLGYETVMLGSGGEGVPLMEKGLIADTTAGGYGIAIQSAWLAESLAVLHNVDLVKNIAPKIIEWSEANGQKLAVVMATRGLTMARALENSPPWAELQKHMDECLGRAAALGARPDKAITHFRYAEVLHKKGDPYAAGKQLSLAIDRFRDMEMSWWIEQAESLAGRLLRDEPFRGFAPYVDRVSGA